MITKKKWLLKYIPISRLECKNHTLFMTKMAKSAKIDTLFMTNTAEKTIPFGAAHTYIAHIREYPPGLTANKESN